MVARMRAWGGVAAIAGGALWIAKAGAILLTGVQPALLFEVAPLPLALALVALAASLQPPSALQRVALGAAVAAAACGAATSALALTGRAVEPWIGLAFVGILVALTASGILVRMRRGMGRWSAAPLALAAAFPLLAFGLPGVALAAGVGDIDRVIEVPILLLGAGWVVLGAAMIGTRRTWTG